MSLIQLTEALSDMEVVELGQILEQNMPVSPMGTPFYHLPHNRIELGDACTDYQLLMGEHAGTHVDAFRHIVAQTDYEWIDEMPLSVFCGSCITIDASQVGPDGLLEKEGIQAWESAHGPISEGTAVLIDFDWMKRWRRKPDDGPFLFHHPAIGPSAAGYLAEKGVRIVGVDTKGVDSNGDRECPVHHILLGHRIPVIENLRNLPKIRNRQGYLAVLPLLIRGGSASPIRPVVLVDRQN